MKTAYSILDLAVVSKGNNIKKTIENSIQLAQKAEAAGYTRYWFAEHHNMAAIASNAPTILISTIAQATTSIKVGSGGVMLPNHAPLIVAEQFGTLGSLYPNRIDLGLGRAPGTDQDTVRAINPGFLQAAHSFPEDVQQIQTYFSVDNKTAKVRAPIAEGVNVPIYILGSSTDSAHLAAKKGLPYAFASHFATAQLFNALDVYRSEFKASKELAAPYVIAGVNVFIADTDEEAAILSTSYIRMIYALLTAAKREYLEEATAMTPDLVEIMKHPAVQNMAKYSFIGSKATVKAKVKEFLQHTKVDELIVASYIHNQASKIKSYEMFAEVMQEIGAES